MKVPFREKYAFGVGALGKDAVICFVNTFLLFTTQMFYIYPQHLLGHCFLVREFGMPLMIQ